jgi:nucleotide-binding universal stress UspA family protein
MNLLMIMSLPKTMLVPTDFGEAAEDALDYATTLATRLGARVVLLNVLRLPVFYSAVWRKKSSALRPVRFSRSIPR